MSSALSNQPLAVWPAWCQFFQNSPPLNSENPDHLIIAYLECGRRFELREKSSFVYRIEGFVLNELRNELYRLYDQGKLSPYDIIHLKFKDPEVLQNRGMSLLEYLNLFVTRLKNNPHSINLREQALKIHHLIHGDPSIKEKLPDNLLYLTIQGQKSQLVLDCFLWAAHAPGLTGSLFGASINPVDRIIAGTALLELVDRHMKGETYVIPNKDLFILYKITNVLQYEKMKREIVTTLKSTIMNQNTILSPKDFCQVAKFILDGLEDNSLLDILNYCNSWVFNRYKSDLGKENVFFRPVKTFDIRQSWKFSVNIFGMNDFMETFLKLCGGYIYECKIDPKIIPDLLYKNQKLPGVNKVILSGEGSCAPVNLNELQLLFPNAKRCTMNTHAFRNLENHSFVQWENIEHLEVLDEDKSLYYLFDCDDLPMDLMTNPPDKIKCIRFISDLPLVLRVRKNTLFIMGDPTKPKDSFDFSDFKDVSIPGWIVRSILLCPTESATSINLEGRILEDQIIREVAEKHPKLAFFNIGGCKLDEETSLFIAQKLPDLEYLNLQSCEISAENVLAIAVKLPKLKYLNLRSSKISAQDYQKLKKILPRCHFILSDSHLPKRFKAYATVRTAESNHPMP